MKLINSLWVLEPSLYNLWTNLVDTGVDNWCWKMYNSSILNKGDLKW